MQGFRAISGAAAVICAVTPSLAFAQTSLAEPERQALEARIAQLENELNNIKAEIRASSHQSTNKDPILAASVAPQAPALISPNPQQIAAQTAPARAPVSAPILVAPLSEGFRVGDHTIKLGGFIKVDASVSKFSDGNPESTNLGRAAYLPSSIPIGGEAEDAVTDMNARQTRFWITSDGVVAGHKVGTRLEMDFQVLPGNGDSRTTNPANPAMRRAYITVDNWLIGQDFTNFATPEMHPETADYVGVTDGAVLVRQPQVRYSRNGWAISLENPETTIDPYLSGARITADDNSLPDATASYTYKASWGQMRLAGLVRQLKYIDRATDIDTTATGWGLSASALFKLNQTNDVRLLVTGGEGIGRYIGLNFGNDAVLDADGQLQALGNLSGFAAYRHVWQPGLRSNLIASAQIIDNPEHLTGPLVNRSATSVRGNLIWSPFKTFDLGTELMFGKREIQNGDSGDLTRLVLFAKYGF